MGEVIYELRQGVAEITINRPEKRNALNKAVREGLFGAFKQANDDPGCRVVILTAAGEKAFSAGGDLKEMADTAFGIPPRDFIPILRRNVEMDKPVIGAINGAAIAGGFLLSQMCDLVVAADHAVFSIAEVRRGRGAPWAAPLSTMIPRRIVMELLLTGGELDAPRAYQVGLVNRVVPVGDLMETARAMAAQIAANAPLSVAGALRISRLPDEMGMHAALDMADEIFKPIYSSEDALEGPRAFREGRAPNWKGR
jgi:enoyl-CoA hydratase/carnithine racemase